MENQAGGGHICPNGADSQNNVPFHLPPLYNNHQATHILPNIERLFEIDSSFTHDQTHEMNRSAPEELDDISSCRKGHWSIEEDRKLLSLVNKHGAGKWALISPKMEGRDGKQCSARWNNHLRPDIKKDTWTEEEEKVLIEAHEIFGNKWAKIAKRIPGRSENFIKNHWHSTKRKQLLMQKRMKNNNSTVLEDYMKTKILKETNVHNSTTPISNTNSTSGNHSNNLEIS